MEYSPRRKNTWPHLGWCAGGSVGRGGPSREGVGEGLVI